MMLFLVIKEFEPQDPDAYFKENVVDNTVYVLLDPKYRDFHIYVNRKDTKKMKFVPYKVSVDSIKNVLSFLQFIFFPSSRIQLDVYHATELPKNIEDSNTVLDFLSFYANEYYNVVGFHKNSEREKSFRLIEIALKQLKHTY